MLNTKIKQLLLFKDMSPSRFADEIGVQRAIISHILSGRNRPSLEVVQKIIRRFPELGMDWIIEEDDTLDEGEIIDKNQPAQPASAITVKTDSLKDQPLKEYQANQEIVAERKIEKILIFYSDKTFTEYRPG
ncbi:helix-turn-helix transcriptional regulator [Rhodocytophaga rosea]|uniref:Helix-turn-helix transcriptional regulator n=1 Tax=Rhodocytophaga rosea TaxID=2704465 RepID=A0A6C0GV29_9BACT|nr:helix-turn-helix transcriptional regulator [Rhodocytophaga rosea]QHT71200.1 helix-turn-helix transcriptional regulator [Rhodocytophaga rosea]